MIEFEKVSFEQFKKDYVKQTQETSTAVIREIYDKIKLPQRSTANSAGYDFFAPTECVVGKDLNTYVCTGIRVKMSPEWVMMIFPRSSLGIKRGISLANTTGIIDSDYYDADNEGHIHIVLTTSLNQWQHIFAHERIAQGIVLPYGVAENGNTDTKRTGGIGSTGK